MQSIQRFSLPRFLSFLARQLGLKVRVMSSLLAVTVISLAACSVPFSPDHSPAATLATHGDAVIVDEPDFQARGHLVSVDFNRLLALRAPEREDAFLHLPDGTLLAFQVEETEGEPPMLWRGQLVADGSETPLTLSRSGQRLAAGFVWQGQRYGLTTRSGGTSVLWEDDTPMPKESSTLTP